MNTPIEDRLRAHFADRAEREPLAPPSVPPASFPTFAPGGPDHRRRYALLAAAVVLLVGLVTGIAVVVADDDPRKLDTISPDEATTTSATAASTTTVAPSSTTTAPPPNAADVRSVVVSTVGVLGGWDGTRWVMSDRAKASSLVGGERYLVVGVDEPIIDAIGSAPGETCDLGEGALETVAFDPAVFDPSFPDRLPNPIVVTGVGNPRPRPVVRLAANTTVYVDAARNVLAGIGLDVVAPRLTDVVKVDLEGDGVDEVVVVAEQVANAEGAGAAIGDYSVVFVRKVVDGQVQTRVLWSSAVGSGDNGEPLYPPDLYFIVIGRLQAVADLNGDGRMEVVLSGFYYEGRGTYVFDADLSGPVLAVGCGV